MSQTDIHQCSTSLHYLCALYQQLTRGVDMAASILSVAGRGTVVPVADVPGMTAAAHSSACLVLHALGVLAAVSVLVSAAHLA